MAGKPFHRLHDDHHRCAERPFWTERRVNDHGHVQRDKGSDWPDNTIQRHRAADQFSRLAVPQVRPVPGTRRHPAGGIGCWTWVGLAVPPSWAVATPAIRTVAAALSATAPDAVPAAALGEGSLLSSMSAAGMVGSAFGAGAPTALTRAGNRSRLTPLKNLKDSHSPEQLQRLVAQLSQKPESVQHHTVDPEGLDGLLEQLAKKPGVHAVHLTKGGKSKVLPPNVQSF